MRAVKRAVVNGVCESFQRRLLAAARKVIAIGNLTQTFIVILADYLT